MSEKEVKKVKINVDFNEASSRENIKSGESLNTIFGKIRKIITDLHSSAFTGNAAKVNGHSVNSDVPANAVFTDTKYTHPNTSGNKHIPSGGNVGQILKNTADGTAAWTNLAMGGTNLLLNSEFNDGTKYWTLNVSGTTMSVENDCLKVVPVSAFYSGAYISNAALIDGCSTDKYTVSLLLKADSEKQILLGSGVYFTDGTKKNFSISCTVNTTWQKFVLPLELTTSNTDIKDIIVTVYNQKEDTIPFYIKHLKLEKGADATDWSPSPKDYYTEAEIESKLDEKMNFRCAVVGPDISLTTIGDKVYYKFASIDIPAPYSDRQISFKVSAGYADWLTTLGILTAHVRVEKTGEVPHSELVWEYALSGIDTSRYILTHNTATDPITVELWYKAERDHKCMHFDVINEGTRRTSDNVLWTLYNNVNRTGGESSLPTDAVVQYSTLGVLKNDTLGTVNGHSVNSDVPANAKFTDTTYNNATTSEDGLMSSSDKKKLNDMTTDDALSNSSTNPLQNNTITAELGKKVNTSVLPNDRGDIKTKFRIANRNYTNGDSWYFPLCKLPSNSGSNYASVIISGRIGGYQGNNISAISAMIWSRSGTDIALFNFGGALLRDNIEWEYADIVAYENSDSTVTVYLKCQGYFVFDLDLKIYQYECELLYDGTHITSTPTGTFKVSASTSTNKAELINGKFYVAGKEVALSDNIPTYGAATQSAAGLMSAADKKKLDRQGDMLAPVTSINSNSDLNSTDYIKIGVYTCRHYDVVTTLINCPVKEAFMMEVYSPIDSTYDNELTATWIYRVRKIMTTNGHMYIQKVTSSDKAGEFTYGSWYKIYSELDKPSDATESQAGLMTAADKKKLNSGVATKLDSSSYTEVTIATSDWMIYASSSSSAMGGGSSSSTNPDTSGYCCTVTLDTPMPYEHFNFDVKLSTDDAAAKLQIQSWNYIMADGRIEQTTDESGNTTEVTFYAFTTQPTVELVIAIQGVSE